MAEKYFDYNAFETWTSMEFSPYDSIKIPYEFFTELVSVTCALLTKERCKYRDFDVPENEVYMVEVLVHYDIDGLKDNYIYLPNNFTQTSCVAKITREVYLSPAEINEINLKQLIENMFKVDCEFERRQNDKRILAENDLPMIPFY